MTWPYPTSPMEENFPTFNQHQISHAYSYECKNIFLKNPTYIKVKKNNF